MARKLIISPQPLAREEGFWTRSCRLDCADGDEITASRDLYYTVPDTIEPPADEDCDGYLLAALLMAMKESRAIQIKGRVSRSLLGNLEEYRNVWCAWLPHYGSDDE